MVLVMNMDELKKRKTPRYQSFDYNSSGVYFITICTQNRRCILSRIVGTGVLDCPQIELTKYGQIADKYIGLTGSDVEGVLEKDKLPETE